MVSKWKVYFRIIQSAEDDMSAFPNLVVKCLQRDTTGEVVLLVINEKKKNENNLWAKRQVFFRYYQTIQEQKHFSLLVFIGSVWIGPRFEVQPRIYSMVFLLFF